MKTCLLICQAMADGPVEDLGGRTPLEAAKTPFLDQLGQAGKMGSVSFIPSALEPRAEVACLSALGYNPEEFYTGLAPLDCLGLAIEQNDQEITFRCDLVTALDETLIDVTAGSISDRESALLVQDLQKKLGSPEIRFCPGEGYRNILVIKDAEISEELDNLELAVPRSSLGQKIKKRRTRSKADARLNELLEKAAAILEAHEINRVRIDLKENPANRVWLWAQGRKPKLPSFKQRFDLKPCVYAQEISVRGIGRAVGSDVRDKVNWPSVDADFNFVYFGSEADGSKLCDLKSKIKWIEDFDAQVVGPAVQWMQSQSSARVAVASDAPHSFEKKCYQRGHVPFVIAGHGVQGQNGGAFNEKNCAQSARPLEEGYRWVDQLIK